MKKYFVISVVTVVFLIIFGNLPEYVMAQIPQSSIIMLEEKNYIESVVANGEVKKENGKYIATDFPLVIKKVFITEGDEISVGDLILTVNRRKTTEKILALSALMGEKSEMEQNTTFTEIYDQIPSEVRSSADGIIETVFVSSDQSLEKEGLIASFYTGEEKKAILNISEDKISQLEIGQKVEITGDGFFDKTYNGKIISIADYAQKIYLGTRVQTVVEVVVELDNPDEFIKEGYTVKGKIFTENEQIVNFLPYESVMQDDFAQEFVYVFDNGVAVRKNIKTGVEFFDGVQILEGISSEDSVILSPDNVKSDGDRVKINIE